MRNVGRKLFIAFNAFVQGPNHAAQSAGQTTNFIRAGRQIGNTDAIMGNAAFFRAVISNLNRVSQIGQRVGDQRRQNQ